MRPVRSAFRGMVMLPRFAAIVVLAAVALGAGASVASAKAGPDRQSGHAARDVPEVRPLLHDDPGGRERHANAAPGC